MQLFRLPLPEPAVLRTRVAFNVIAEMGADIPSDLACGGAIRLYRAFGGDRRHRPHLVLYFPRHLRGAFGPGACGLPPGLAKAAAKRGVSARPSEASGPRPSRDRFLSSPPHATIDPIRGL